MKSSVATPKLSVIVPVYNAEKYLTHCVNSILAQEFESFELLLIDDGSTDASATMCDEYAAKDERIRVFHQPNGGVSVARNMGLKNAKGGWISFVDSDDTIESEHFKNLMEHADEVDWVQTGDKDVDLEGKIIGESKVDEIIEDGSEGINDYIIMLPRFGLVRNKIFRADILKKNNIQFRPWLSLQEDKVFVFDYLKCSNSFIILPYSTYHYRYNVGLSSKRKYYVPSVFLNLAEALDTYVNDDSFGIKTHEYIAQFVSKLYFRAFCSCFNPISKLDIKKRLKSAHCIVKSFLNSRLIKAYGLGTTKYLFWMFKYYAKKLLSRFIGS